ncbi:hypothetical protein Back2_09070 [Nocardioides baekrokdamisoli]|uniref:Cyclase n=1 Tax=Nocardioides baekrokdamisoli TaxID=1804624 RepID=A0A3G9ICF1_9ACTN|nr:SRPBCC family protein [Nocardioides baekrokdamisoli]BBH16620.1 hypothetical protein Back2_09070 [Nocardioides baekrokdamisoli]
MPVIRLETVIHAPIEACFDLSLSVDFHVESMDPSGERAVAGVTSGVMELGDQVAWAARHFGIPVRMTSLISAYERPSFFVDEQLRGPFKRWRHEHWFESVDDGTWMIDVVEFAAPAGPIGILVEQVGLTAYMAKLLRQRNTHLKAALET